jgi:quinol monooxygenase YgiN
MFVRFVKIRIRPDMVVAFQRFYDYEAAPELLRQPGCMFAHLIQSEGHDDEFNSLTFWRSRADADVYETSGAYDALIKRNRPFLADSTEWRMQLDEDLTLSYLPVKQEPEVEAFDVAAASTEDVPDESGLLHMYLRIVAGRVRMDQIDAFRAHYQDNLIPALLETNGCRYAYLAAGRDEGEMMSVTLWDSQSHASAYEESGRFEELMGTIRPMLSSLTQWKMTLDPGQQARTTTSDDVSVSGFRVLGGDQS